MTKKIAMLGLFALGFVGCHDETVESEDIRTSGIWAKFEVLATGNGKTSVTSQLRVGGDDGTIVILMGEDKLVCTAGETKKTLAKDGDYYKGTFTGDAGNTEFNFAFNRGDEDEAAPRSFVALPDPFAIAGVEATQEVSRAAALTVTWEPGAVSDVATTWTLDGACLFKTDGTVTTDATLTLQGTDFDPTPSAEQAAAGGDKAGASCTATLCIERKRNGTLDPAFAKEEGGTIYAIQRRCAAFVSTP